MKIVLKNGERFLAGFGDHGYSNKGVWERGLLWCDELDGALVFDIELVEGVLTAKPELPKCGDFEILPVRLSLVPV